MYFVLCMHSSAIISMVKNHTTWFYIDFFLNNQQDAIIIQIYSIIKLYMFRASSPPIIRSFLLYSQHWYVSCRFLMTVSQQSQDWTAFHPDSAGKRSSKTCMKLTSADCTVENSWWWAEKMPAESGWNCVPSWLCWEAVIKNLHETYQCWL